MPRFVVQSVAGCQERMRRTLPTHTRENVPSMPSTGINHVSQTLSISDSNHLSRPQGSFKNVRRTVVKTTIAMTMYVAHARGGQAVQAPADALHRNDVEVLRPRVVGAVHDRTDGQAKRHLVLVPRRTSASALRHDIKLAPCLDASSVNNNRTLQLQWKQRR